ncbi:unnamed protein product [Nezara viridula]|uniref:Glycosyl transferase CAP10 domain-containing protein n=1 Tax=Nezara viridula TaxID=85310 RepID=A0A9P0E9J3_NEZVI|nr:unnamed protein product [Nezara viridula]
MMQLIQIVSFLLMIKLSNTNEYCDSISGKCSENNENIYSKEYYVYLTTYLRKNADYQPSNDTCFESNIADDLRIFKNGITKEMLNNAYSKGVKYQIINHELYRSQECLFPTRCNGVEYFLIQLKSELPDFECVINFYDWPQISKHHGSPVPVFSFSKTKDYYDIMYPAWSFWDGGPAIKIYPKGLGRWDLHRKKLISVSKEIQWEEKKKVFFFRGSRTSSERDVIVQLSRKEKDLVNASYTKNQAWKSDKDTLGYPPAEEVALEDHCIYRYLFNFRGVTASFRFKYLFLCKSLVLHIGNEWNEFFYNHMKPWVHYIPLRTDDTENDYRKLMNFILKEDKVAQEIAFKGYKFIRNKLRMKDIRCYWRTLLTYYSKLLKFQPKLDETLKKIS